MNWKPQMERQGLVNGVILELVKSSPAAVAVIVVVVLFLKQMAMTEERQLQALSAVSNALKLVEERLREHNGEVRDALMRFTDVINRVSSR
jgi:hypothetical protein